MSIRDAAFATGLTPKALRRRIERGTLQSVMVDGRRRIAMEELLERGLLVPLDADGRPRLARPVQRPPVAPNALTERLRTLERRVSAIEEQLGRRGAPAIDDALGRRGPPAIDDRLGRRSAP